MAFLPDGTMFVADGYNGNCVVKLDKKGTYITAWGERGTPPNETRPGYFNVVHGIAGNLMTHRIYVSDRGDRRMQVFDENGKFLDQWPFNNPSSVKFVYTNGSWPSSSFSSRRAWRSSRSNRARPSPHRSWRRRTDEGEPPSTC